MKKSEKRLRFEKVASNRVQNVIHFLTLLQNCANRNNYEYTEKDVNLMFGEMQKALREAKAVYTGELSNTKKQEFKFE